MLADGLDADWLPDAKITDFLVPQHVETIGLEVAALVEAV